MLVFLANYPFLIALLALLISFVLGAWLMGAFRTARDEARMGITLLCRMRWNEYCQLISESLKDRGLQPANTARAPGQDGFDLLFTRGKGRYLVQSRNAATQNITRAAVEQLHNIVKQQEADGAIIVSCAPALPDALKLADEHHIEIIADQALWWHVKPWVAHDQRTDAESVAATARRQRFLGATLISLIVAIATYALVPTPQPAEAHAAPPVTNNPPVTPATTPKPALPVIPQSEEQLASRRASAVMEVRSLIRVDSASWSTRSTLEIQVRDHLDDEKLAGLVDDICRSLLQYEELRFTRLQLEIPNADASQPVQVRWRQCR